MFVAIAFGGNRTMKEKNVTVFLVVLGVLLFQGTVVYADSEVNESIKSLNGVKSKISGIKSSLTGTHATINDQITGPVEEAKKSVAANTQKVEDSIKNIDESGGYKKAVLGSFCLPDLRPTLGYIKDHPLKTIKQALSGVGKNFNAVKEDLNAKTDPKKIYKHLGEAQKSLDVAIKKLEALKALVTF